MKATKSGKVAITTTGRARKLFVKLSVKAPANGAYSFTKKWAVK